MSQEVWSFFPPPLFLAPPRKADPPTPSFGYVYFLLNFRVGPTHGPSNPSSLRIPSRSSFFLRKPEAVAESFPPHRRGANTRDPLPPSQGEFSILFSLPLERNFPTHLDRMTLCFFFWAPWTGWPDRPYFPPIRC